MSLPAGYSQVGAHPHELAIGFEPLDALRGGRVGTPLRFEIEGPRPLPAATEGASYHRQSGPGPLRPVIDRHDSCLYALLYHQVQPYTQPPQQLPMPLAGLVNLRIYDHRRRFVPRRFAVPLPPLLGENDPPRAQRVRRPLLFPGAACELSSRATGIRARVLRAGAPLRWTRVEATLAGGEVVGRAHGDDRGEFLLVLDPSAAPAVELVDPLSVRVTVYAPAVAPLPLPPDLLAQDFLWDLPLESLPAPGAPDLVSTGEQLPAGYVKTAGSSRLVPFRLGRLISVPDFVFA